ncbi:endonuclease G, mitochondrial isoform X2 [Electrophorus electricus]|uniref:Endonuclease n=1 Tax=Electrophorus electricus TaxID=8005 RepID=A0A4W4H7A2_ELEEL|nr:endonuclease G, mitochondrial isoform X2 [Electrophorus electricus]
MRRAFSSRWLISSVSLTVGAGIGVALAAASDARGSPPIPGGLLHRVPIIPVPSVHAASELAPYPRGPSTPSRSAAAAKYGLPSLPHVTSREGYVMSYDPRNRTAAWVIERLNAETVRGASERGACAFREDDSVHAYHRARNADYRGSGFDRGHLAAAANHKWSQKAMDDTFYLSNVAPQNPHLNQNAWNNLEKHCRALTKHYENVFVCSGPLYLPRQEPDGKMYVKYQVIGKSHVAVPTHFFKVVILETQRGGVELRPYVMPNAPVDDKIPLERFLVPIESIERASGLLFVPNILHNTSSLQAITAHA